jgi:uncharacterized protein YlxW (UPF0749 family)
MSEPPPANETRQRTGKHRAGALIGVLVAMLGFGIAVQVHANSSSDKLASLREDDLIGILDNQSAQADRLRQQIAQLELTLAGLQNSGDKAAAARQQAEQEQQDLGILLGTIPATGPGVRVTITDPSGVLQPEDLLDVIEELRGAGAEAIQFGTVRVSTSTALTSAARGSITVDGTRVSAPYTVLAIGESATLDTALNIPGGVAAVLRADGADLTVEDEATVTISAVRALPVLHYATPSSAAPSGH